VLSSNSKVFELYSFFNLCSTSELCVGIPAQFVGLNHELGEFIRVGKSRAFKGGVAVTSNTAAPLAAACTKLYVMTVPIFKLLNSDLKMFVDRRHKFTTKLHFYISKKKVDPAFRCVIVSFLNRFKSEFTVVSQYTPSKDTKFLEYSVGRNFDSPEAGSEAIVRAIRDSEGFLFDDIDDYDHPQLLYIDEDTGGEENNPPDVDLQGVIEEIDDLLNDIVGGNSADSDEH